MDIFKILTDKLNANSQKLKFIVYDQLHYYDSQDLDNGVEVIQCVLGSPAGEYFPLQNVKIENHSRMLQIFFPLEIRNEIEIALEEFKTSLIGFFLTSEDGDAFVFNMDVPIISAVKQQVLREFSSEDGRFRFSSKPYGVVTMRIYYKITKDIQFGNSFIFKLDGYQIPFISQSVTSSREVSTYQFVAENTIHSYPNANAVSYTFTALVDNNKPPIISIAKQALSGGSLERYYGTLTIELDKTKLLEIPVICSMAQVLCGLGDIATITFSLVRYKEVK